MPIFLDTKEIKLVLKSDKDKENPPAFLYRVATARDVMKMAGMYDAAQDNKSGEKNIAMLIDLVKLGLTGWENMGMEFDAEQIADLLTIKEITELAEARMSGASISDTDRKN